MKNTTIKISFYCLSVFGSNMLCTSCLDDIDVYPVENNMTQSFYANELEVNQAAVGIYARLGKNGSNDDFPTLYYWCASENRSDILYIRTDANAQRDQMDLRKYMISISTPMVSTIYSRLYAVIKEANNLLYFTKDKPAEYSRYRAEACFLRAYAYWELARAFGPTALLTEPTENRIAIEQPRTPTADIYKQVIADLTEASNGLEDFYTGSDAGRVGRIAAQALLGQVYMTMAGYPNNDASAYDKAESTLAAIITQVDTRWCTDYSNLFILENENKYDLFSIQFASGSASNVTGSSLPGYISSGSASQTPFPDWVFDSYTQQGQDMCVDTFLVTAMKADKDKRLLPSVDTGFYTGGRVGSADRIWTDKTVVTKFLEKDPTNSTIKAWNDFPRNFPILRPADVYLLYAEALIQNNKAANALPYINKIRTRAGLPDLNGTPTLADIKFERKREFIGEGKRYFDLVRWGANEAIQVLTDFVLHYNAVYNSAVPTVRDLLLPIPQNEMKTRTNWENNFGYY
ncbi:MAG: RagB/SusD family nutrient uptake outer membrane protein [Bacteroidales bacterium]|jgi:hypothetical protein|nr:RagB/SusD family nutrient uptake outer membrane protein [Bacteroidales bacterium]